MSNKTFVDLWNETKKSLQKVIKDEKRADALPPEKSRSEAFDKIGDLYVKYSRLAKVLEECCDQFVHPQKRQFIKQLLEATIGRALELRHELVAIDCTEYHFLGEVLLTNHLLPEDVELPVPSYFQRDPSPNRQNRDRILDEVFERYGERRMEAEGEGVFMTVEDAIRLIQIHERARQGRARARLMREIRRTEETESRFAEHVRSTPKYDIHKAAVIIQKLWRGYSIRKAINDERNRELILLGMKAPKDNDDAKKKAEVLKERRRVLQEQYQKRLESAVVTTRQRITDEEGPAMRERMQNDIREWYTTAWNESGKFPDYPTEEEGGSVAIFAEKVAAEPEKKEKVSTTSKKKVTKVKEKKRSRRERRGKQEVEVEPGYVFTKKPSYFVFELDNILKNYEGRFTRDDDGESLDHDLIEEERFPEVEASVRLLVDQVMRQEIELLKFALERDKGKRSRKMKSTKKGSKKSKGKKKEKDLTPERTLESLVEELVQQEIIKQHPTVYLEDYLGDYSYCRTETAEKNVIPEPSLSEVKRAIVDYCILPLGSAAIHRNVPTIRSVLFAGPSGTGKNMLVNTICTATGATLFDLTATNIAGKYSGKAGLTMLVHLVNKLARRLQPSVILIQDAEKVFLKKVPRHDRTDPKRLKKDLPRLVKGIGVDDRILLCGTTHQPFEADLKALSACYQKILYIPKPDYASRTVLWRETILKNRGLITQELDIISLNKLSDSYSAGVMCSVIRQVLTDRRVAQMVKYPLVLTDFTNLLAQFDPVYRKEEDAYRTWFGKTVLGRKRLKLLKEAAKSEEGGESPESAKPKKKKKVKRKR